MSCEINSRFRRFSYGTGQLTGLSVNYIEFIEPLGPRASSDLQPPYLVNSSELLGPESISPCTIAMDHDAIICSMIDRLARGPDQDVHVLSVVGQKYPSYNVDGIYL